MKKHIPQMDERIRGFKGYGLVQVLHGHGKGKTTSALGMAIRCAGSGRKVAIVYFDKGGETHYNERAILDRIPEITYIATGRDRIDASTGRFDFSIQEIDKTEAKRGLEQVKKFADSNEYALIILDEIHSTVDLGMLDVQEVLEFIHNKPKQLEVILTGRNPHPEVLKTAHLITNIALEKHYFYSGVPTREGLDF